MSTPIADDDDYVSDSELDDILNDALGSFEHISSRSASNTARPDKKPAETARPAPPPRGPDHDHKSPSGADPAGALGEAEAMAAEFMKGGNMDIDGLVKLAAALEQSVHGKQPSTETQQDVAKGGNHSTRQRSVADMVDQATTHLGEPDGGSGEVNAEMQMMKEILEKMALGGDEGDAADLTGFEGLADVQKSIQDEPEKFAGGLLEHIISRDFLFRPFQEMCSKYPTYLANNRGSLQPEEHERQTKIHRCMQRVVSLYEKDPSDSKATSESVVKVLDELSEYGNPPTELIANIQGADMGKQACSVM